MKRDKAVVIAAALCVAIVVRVRRRGRGRPGMAPGDPARAADPVPAAAAGAAQEPEGVVEGVEVVAAPQRSMAARSLTAWFSSAIQPAVYVRIVQVLLTLLTICGSIFNSVVMSRGQPLMGIIVAMGLLHVVSLEAVLQTTGRAKFKHRAQIHAVASEIPEPEANATAAAVDVDAEAASAHGAAAAAPAGVIAILPYTAEQVSGMWVKDRTRSDSMAPVCDAMHLFGLLRHAIKILKGTHLRLSPEAFDVTAVSMIPLLKIAERYGMDGAEAKNRRRDQRGGGSWGRAEATEEGMVLHYRWGEPFAGTARELFRLTADGEMHIEAVVTIEGEPYHYTLIHRRPGAVAAA